MQNFEKLIWGEAVRTFELDEIIRRIGKSLQPELIFEYSHMQALMTKWSILHEKSKDFDGLLKLKNYSNLIASMPEARKKAVLRRIEAVNN